MSCAFGAKACKVSVNATDKIGEEVSKARLMANEQPTVADIFRRAQSLKRERPQSSYKELMEERDSVKHLFR